MSKQSSKTKTLVQNTILLYIRMIVTMLIALYSSRIILKALGIDDFGLYNVVGGVVALFSFLRTSMTSATQRFLAFELGKEDRSQLKRMFSMCMTTHLLIAFVILFLCETVGLWFLNAKINIPEGREVAANWIYQFSTLTLCLGMITVPYNACVIARERMGIYAYISILEALLKLGIAFALTFVFQYDRLIIYGGLLLVSTVLVFVLYWAICKRKFPETAYQFFFDKELFKQIFGFSGWTLFGQMALMAANHGTTILVNMFYSVAANAAMGVAQQVNHAVSGLVANFQTAYQPQITKSYSSGDFPYLNRLLYNASKVSYFLMFVVSLPIIYNIDFLLELWLGDVPEFSSQFTIFFMIASMMNVIGGPLWMSVFATGKIRNYQIVVSFVFLADLVIVYVLYKIGLPVVSGVIVKAFINFLVVFVRMFFAKQQLEMFSTTSFLKKVLLPIALSTVIVIVLTYPIISMTRGSMAQIMATLWTITVSLVIAFYIGLSASERKAILSLLIKS